MNILISTAGRRVNLVKSFVNAIRNHKVNSKVFISDYDPLINSPAAHFSDSFFEIGNILDKNYINDLILICKKNKIKIIIPTIDTELKLLSENMQLFNDNKIQVIVSEKEFIEKFNDKFNSDKFFRSLGINTPKIYKPSEKFETDHNFGLKFTLAISTAILVLYFLYPGILNEIVSTIIFI